MCPPDSALARVDVNVSSSDEEVMLFLDGRKPGDAVPSNFITEVNPLSLEPWDASEGMWYLYDSVDVISYNKLSTFKVVQNGYWMFVDDHTILRDNVTSGRKIIWEFYMGQEPIGVRTGWLMYDYHKFPKACEGISSAQEWSSMCKVFFQDDYKESIADKKSPDREQSSPFSSSVDGADVESMLLNFLKQEERNSATGDMDQSEGNLQAGAEQVPNRSCQDLLSSDSTGDFHAFVEFSKGEFLELNDLFDLESTSCSSDSDDCTLNSRNSDACSDACFDADAMLRDLDAESHASSDDSTLNSRNSNACFDVDAILRDLDDENHAITRLSETTGSNKIEEYKSSGGYSPRTSSPVHPSDQRFSAGASASRCRPRAHPKRSHSGCSDSSSSSSSGSGSKSIARIARIGKKYCCFAQF